MKKSFRMEAHNFVCIFSKKNNKKKNSFVLEMR